MQEIRGAAQAIYGAQAVRDAQGGGKLLSQGIRIGPGPGFLYAREASAAGTILDARRGRKVAGLLQAHATLAAFRSYRSVYGNSFRGDFETILDDLAAFWLDRFGAGYPTPQWIEPAPDEETSAARKNT